jgi:hypothetical protein
LHHYLATNFPTSVYQNGLWVFMRQLALAGAGQYNRYWN